VGTEVPAVAGIVLQEGSSSKRLLLWPLEAVVPWTVSYAANRRLAYKFGAIQKWADADTASDSGARVVSA
jgi:hypothetical protein